MSVLLPAPFSPTTARTSPRLTARSTPSRAIVAPKRLRMPTTRRRRGDSAVGWVSPAIFAFQERYVADRMRARTGLLVEEGFYFRRIDIFLGDEHFAGVDAFFDLVAFDR